jgi:hypothetical protein
MDRGSGVSLGPFFQPYVKEYKAEREGNDHDSDYHDSVHFIAQRIKRQNFRKYRSPEIKQKM